MVPDPLGDKVFYRNSFGGRASKDLTGERGPSSRRIIDNVRGLEAMDRSEFMQRLRFVAIEYPGAGRMTINEDMSLTIPQSEGQEQILINQAGKDMPNQLGTYIPNGFPLEIMWLELLRRDNVRQ